jgi:hypothetical protein
VVLVVEETDKHDLFQMLLQELQTQAEALVAELPVLRKMAVQV